ncbi:MAG TPA: phytanoyl-CoA dioxygenase family protein [Actinomycetota bacterium]|nr:phytanoyl-CoA dioxygenase family protein [Actinomycetota bacterium]
MPRLVADEQVRFYTKNGYLHVPGVFGPHETDELAQDLDGLIQEWSFEGAWTGPWRDAYLDPDLAGTIKLSALHDLQLYSAAWTRAIVHPGLVAVLVALLGPTVEFHHTTMHVKPPERGAPFPMHQDHPFYPHADDRYVDVLLHLDDTGHEIGELRFLAGSHRRGPLEHIVEDGNGLPCHPHLSTDEYTLEDSVAVPANRGDVVCFNINTVHGSYMNRTDRPRRLVRMGYRHPDNRQLDGQSLGRPGALVSGVRERREGEAPLS